MGVFLRPSSAARIEEISVPQELPQVSRINTTTKVRPIAYVDKKVTDVCGNMMISPEVTEGTYYNE